MCCPREAWKEIAEKLMTIRECNGGDAFAFGGGGGQGNHPPCA